jgi:hypothetical protein
MATGSKFALQIFENHTHEENGRAVLVSNIDRDMLLLTVVLSNVSKIQKFHIHHALCTVIIWLSDMRRMRFPK